MEPAPEPLQTLAGCSIDVDQIKTRITIADPQDPLPIGEPTDISHHRPPLADSRRQIIHHRARSFVRPRRAVVDFDAHYITTRTTIRVIKHWIKKFTAQVTRKYCNAA